MRSARVTVTASIVLCLGSFLVGAWSCWNSAFVVFRGRAVGEVFVAASRGRIFVYRVPHIPAYEAEEFHFLGSLWVLPIAYDRERVHDRIFRPTDINGPRHPRPLPPSYKVFGFEFQSGTPSGAAGWFASMPIWPLMALGGLIATASMYRTIRRRVRKIRGRCTSCGYDLR